ncbi:hypothetical protein SCP_0202060 [Sparassis crispa]|uniref:DUF6697 domain-containing protein n=1 Tax=Sparassis crispa TaxID=139825 RepID=A0A401GA39_9APHY|nr:hypothetical protein SCP_0202060 [Sparassis crispa]GBE79009.1 hypothetical protein SCP_0202060 [Sparassis crispa]
MQDPHDIDEKFKVHDSIFLDASFPSTAKALEDEKTEIKDSKLQIGAGVLKPEERTSSLLDRTRPTAYDALKEEEREIKEPLKKNRRLVAEVLLTPWRDIKRILKERRGTALAEQNQAASASQDETNASPPIAVKDEPVEVGASSMVKKEEMTVEEIDEAFRMMVDPDVKIKKDSKFSYEFVRDRLKAVGFDIYPIPLDLESTKLMFPRLYISQLYGGSFVNTFPKISEERLALHGIDDFMCLHTDYNPHAPTTAGSNGLFFTRQRAEGAWYRPHPMRVLVLCAEGRWRYVGQYALFPSESLTTDEFSTQTDKVKKRWSEEMLKKGWGEQVRMRVYLRRIQVEFSDAEVMELCKDKPFLRKITAKLTWQDIMRAYEVGEEEIGVWVMKCVGYDVKFQKFLINNFDMFVSSMEKAKRGGRKPKTSGRTQRGKKKSSDQTAPKTGSKRKRVVDSESSDKSDEDVDEEGEEEDEVSASRNPSTIPEARDRDLS